MWTADDTSAAEPRAHRPLQRFGRIVVIGGGCYGSYYVRQLGRAAAAGALSWQRLTVVDRDASAAVANLGAEHRPLGLELVVAEWEEFLASYLGSAARHASRHDDDAIVPSPLMPHLMADWLLARARERWPGRAIEVHPLGGRPPVPWQQVGSDGTHYVSFAEWLCPINCIEPARCPETRGPRSWSMPAAVASYAASERAAGREVHEPLLFHCAHRAYGVGMIDVRTVLAADASVADAGSRAPGTFLVGTVSHCHGALRRIDVGPTTG